MYYKLQITKEGNNFSYPVPDIKQITGAKYRNDLNECVCNYPTELGGEDVELITEAVYNSYPKCRVNMNKYEVLSNGVDIVVITVTLPSEMENEQVILYVDGNIADRKTTSTNQATFELTFDNTFTGDLLEVEAESNMWKRSDKKILEVI